MNRMGKNFLVLGFIVFSFFSCQSDEETVEPDDVSIAQFVEELRVNAVDNELGTVTRLTIQRNNDNQHILYIKYKEKLKKETADKLIAKIRIHEKSLARIDIKTVSLMDDCANDYDYKISSQLDEKMTEPADGISFAQFIEDLKLDTDNNKLYGVERFTIQRKDRDEHTLYVWYNEKVEKETADKIINGLLNHKESLTRIGITKASLRETRGYEHDYDMTH
ncbi:hypothetical protein FUAX_45370 (plasmid) [Fulvitalea axinellae]|uniref:Uncharacterized protein n=1 Tax=Fulvitalea axinellae TaxID=1182444 RepID=A0AAU9DHR7_9BACT|nr:hypothetical protein FUAX_45370 [Fulvitalea axinellae]